MLQYLCFQVSQQNAYNIHLETKELTANATAVHLQLVKAQQLFKGKIHTKLKFCHYFLTLKLLQICINVFVLLITKEEYTMKEKIYYGSEWCSETVWLQNIFLCREIYTGLKQHEGD